MKPDEILIAIINLILIGLGVYTLAELSKITGPWTLGIFILIIAILGITDFFWLYSKSHQ